MDCSPYPGGKTPDKANIFRAFIDYKISRISLATGI
jgi:hypothetical protein